MADSPDFFSSEIRGDRFTDFCVHTARFSGNRLQKVGRLEKIGQWDHGITGKHELSFFPGGEEPSTGTVESPFPGIHPSGWV